MAQYFLPCTCGEKVRVETAQAGGQVACACGKSLAVPTLRGLRALEEAPADAAAKRSAGRPWSPLQGILFSSGLLVTVIALGVVAYAFWQYVQATPFTRDVSPELTQLSSDIVDEISAPDALDEFFHLRDEGLGQPTVMPWVHWQKFAAERRWIMIAAGSAAAVGLIAIVAALVMKPAARPV